MGPRLLDSFKVDWDCTKCRSITKESVGWVKAHHNFTCGDCGAVIHLDPDQIRRKFERIEAALATLRRSVKNPFDEEE